MSAPPDLDRRIVEALAAEWLPQAKGRGLLLVFGRYVGADTTFGVKAGDERRRVHVSDQHSVLGIVETWRSHQREHPGDLLVITTSVDDGQLGWDIRAYAIHRSVRTVDRARIVAQRFGAVDIDPRIRDEKWLVEALLDAEPPEGWPRNGSVLTRDAAIRALIGARLGRVVLGAGALGGGALDIATLLDFSLDSAATARFAALPDTERDGLTAWLTSVVGDAAALLLRLTADGRAADALPLGLVGTAVTRANAAPEAVLAFGGLLGGAKTGELGAFTDAVEGALERWVAEAETGGRHSEPARQRVCAVVRRAEELADTVGLTAALADSRFLPSALTTRLHNLAATLTAAFPPGGAGSGIEAEAAKVADADRALDAVRDHHLARLAPERIQAADMAVRLVRWLARPASPPGSVAEAVEGHITDSAWADRALTTLWAGDPAGDPVLGQAYRAVCAAVRARRDTADDTFAEHLARWTRHASADDPGGCLLVEDVLGRVAVPLATAKTAPVVVVLDGMSGAVAVDLAERFTERTWTEVAPGPRRLAAVSAVPSVTRASRASLLTGTLTAGEQATEKDGFAAFWKRHRRSARLFHKADIGGEAGHRLSDPLLEALAEDGTVVGVVLNTIDSALDHGREGDRTGWRPHDITYLPELLDAARAYGRPVVLVSDHGHVLDRGDTAPVSAPGVESARWRTGEAQAGEVALRGPRVVYGGGSVVAAWREDLRYTPRKAGYHGGASLAEMTVPVLVLLPSLATLPTGWQVLTPDEVTPVWWRRRDAEPPPTALPRGAGSAPAAPTPARGRKPPEPENAVPLFALDQQHETVPDAVPEPAEREAADSLGSRVVASEVYEAQRAFVPKSPDRKVVAAVIDALVAADNRLPLSAVAEVAGRAARRPEFFVTTLERLLNVDGYQVLSAVDGGRWVTLDPEVLRIQFALGS